MQVVLFLESFLQVILYRLDALAFLVLLKTCCEGKSTCFFLPDCHAAQRPLPLYCLALPSHLKHLSQVSAYLVNLSFVRNT